MALNRKGIFYLLFVLLFLIVCFGLVKGEANSECVICGKGSLVRYYEKKDLLVVVNLANGQITPLETLRDNEDGSLNTGSSTTLNSDGNGRTVYTTTQGRGICLLKVFWDPGEPLELTKMKVPYCEECNATIKALDQDREDYFLEWERCPFILVDSVTKDIYSLNGFRIPKLIRNYYLELNIDNQAGEIEGVVFYAPDCVCLEN